MVQILCEAMDDDAGSVITRAEVWSPASSAGTVVSHPTLLPEAPPVYIVSASILCLTEAFSDFRLPKDVQHESILGAMPKHDVTEATVCPFVAMARLVAFT